MSSDSMTILHPFGEDPEAEEEFQRKQRTRALIEQRADDGFDAAEITSREVKDHSAFRQSADMALRSHFSGADAVRQKFFATHLPEEVQSAIHPHEERLGEALDRLQKAYKIYVDTAADESLEREAERLERRYFKQLGVRNQIDFLRMRRLYEKLRTFNETAKKEWREINKVVDNLIVLKETRAIAVETERELLRPIQLLIRQSDSFLDEVKLYLEVTAENVDRITGSYKIDCEYNPKKIYSKAALFGDSEAAPAGGNAAVAPESETKQTDDAGEYRTSIAYNIVLETREHKLNRASLINVPLLGSRDWNRSPDYHLEIPLRYFEDCARLFRDAYHVNYDDANILHTPLATAAAVVRRGMGEAALAEYHELCLEIINTTAVALLVEDFPGVDKPEVFLYHCGPNVFYRILVAELRRRGLGEIYYLDDNNNSVRELPEELLKKILIDWWNERFRELSREDVDSYLTYSRQLEMVKREYRALYEEGVALRKREQPGVSYIGVEKWLKDNKSRVFGVRKVEIFRRFVTGAILE